MRTDRRAHQIRRENSEGLCLFYEDHLADNEAMAGVVKVDVRIYFLLLGQNYAERDRMGLRLAGYPIFGFHDPWASAGDNRISGFSQPPSSIDCKFVSFV